MDYQFSVWLGKERVCEASSKEAAEIMARNLALSNPGRKFLLRKGLELKRGRPLGVFMVEKDPCPA